MDKKIAEKETLVRRLESETSVSTEGQNLIRYKMVDMETRLPEEPQVKKRLDELKSALAALVTAWKDSDQKAGLGDEQYQKYAGHETCKGCHTGQYEFWSKTKHAHAMETLEKVIQDVNPECIGCHSLGFREEGGFQRPYNAARFANVQCEHCHGPRVEHVKAPLKSAKSAPVTAEACKPCHAGAGPKFDFATAIKIAGCPPELSSKKPEKK
jgi:nitrate/TMAO reductase-like tetraheme cytochrome c subunit